ncbi:MAG: hypothetical protein AAF599_03900 [Bacteroidota bacterium]
MVSIENRKFRLIQAVVDLHLESSVKKVEQLIMRLVIEEQEKNKVKNRDLVMRMAGAWNDMSNEDFNDYLQETKNVSNDMFSRNIEL